MHTGAGARPAWATGVYRIRTRIRRRMTVLSPRLLGLP